MTLADTHAAPDICATAPSPADGPIGEVTPVTSDQALAIENTAVFETTVAQVTPRVTAGAISASSGARPQPAAMPRTSRSALTNGSRMLVGVNGGSALARRFRDLVNGLANELGDGLTEAERLMVRNAASLQLHVEDLTAQLARGEPVDPEAFTRAANAASRAISALRRRAKPKSKVADIRSYLASRGAPA